MSSVPVRQLTPAEYLAVERAADHKSEYYRGEMFSMAGASREHNLIVHNLARGIGNRLADTACEAYSNDMRVKVDATGLYTYPDVVVTCEKPRFEDSHVDTLLNPTLVIEVVSKSTESYDRGKKAGHYRQIPSLQEYLLVSQHEQSVERYSRQKDGRWQLDEATSLDASIWIEAVGAALPLAEIYLKVEFGPPRTPPSPPGVQ